MTLAPSRSVAMRAVTTITYLTASLVTVNALPQMVGAIVYDAPILPSDTSGNSITLTGQPASNTSANIARLTKGDPKIIAIVSISTIAFCILVGLVGYFIRYPPASCSKHRTRKDEGDEDAGWDDEDSNEDAESQKENIGKQHAPDRSDTFEVVSMKILQGTRNAA